MLVEHLLVVLVLRDRAHEAPLEHLLAVDLLLDGAARDQAVHHHVPLLADAVRAVDALVVNAARRDESTAGNFRERHSSRSQQDCVGQCG